MSPAAASLAQNPKCSALPDMHDVEDLRGMGVRLVVKRTFLQFEAEQTPSASGEHGVGQCRAFSAPCFDRDTGDEAETDSSEASQADGTQSPTDVSSESRALDDAVVRHVTADFLTGLSSSLFGPAAMHGHSGADCIQADEKTHEGWRMPTVAFAAGVSAPYFLDNEVLLVTPANACVLCLGIPLENTCIVPGAQPGMAASTFMSYESLPTSAPLTDAEPLAPTKQRRVRHEGRTTLMLKNIPNDYSRTMLLDLLDAQGFAGRYDFIYLPIDFKRSAGLGYAFINCVAPSDAVAMKQQLHGFKQWRVASQKICEVRWGEPLQGLEAHIERYRNSSVMHHAVPDGYKPIVLLDGVRSPFPAPTKRIRMPQVKAVH